MATLLHRGAARLLWTRPDTDTQCQEDVDLFPSFVLFRFISCPGFRNEGAKLVDSPGPNHRRDLAFSRPLCRGFNLLPPLWAGYSRGPATPARDAMRPLSPRCPCPAGPHAGSRLSSPAAGSLAGWGSDIGCYISSWSARPWSTDGPPTLRRQEAGDMGRVPAKLKGERLRIHNLLFRVLLMTRHGREAQDGYLEIPFEASRAQQPSLGSLFLVPALLPQRPRLEYPSWLAEDPPHRLPTCLTRLFSGILPR